ncbi:MAG: hypothetical protein IKC75_05370 [Clostridia bacterium]|nr:hypothetical protein [Clostridia bacterium]
MKLLFLGTGGSEVKLVPECEVTGEYRRATSMLIDENVVVDLGIQSFDFATKLGAKTDGITDIFLSHTHRDHYMKQALLGYLSVAKCKIDLWCPEVSAQAIAQSLSEEELEKVTVHPVKPLDRWEAGGLSILALPANHTDPNTVHYVFEKDGKRLYYGLDGMWFAPLEWRWLFRGAPLDAAIIDATFVCENPRRFGKLDGHNNIITLPAIRDFMRATGVARPDTVLLASHVAPQPDEAEEWFRRLEEMGYLPTYDGFVFEV